MTGQRKSIALGVICGLIVGISALAVAHALHLPGRKFIVLDGRHPLVLNGGNDDVWLAVARLRLATLGRCPRPQAPETDMEIAKFLNLDLNEKKKLLKRIGDSFWWHYGITSSFLQEEIKPVFEKKLSDVIASVIDEELPVSYRLPAARMLLRFAEEEKRPTVPIDKDMELRLRGICYNINAEHDYESAAKIVLRLIKDPVYMQFSALELHTALQQHGWKVEADEIALLKNYR